MTDRIITNAKKNFEDRCKTESQGEYQDYCVLSHTFPLLYAGEVDKQPSRESPEDSIIQVERPVGSANDHDIIVLPRLEAVHLLHELGDNAAMRDGSPGLPGSHPGTEERVNFIDEDNTRREPPGKREHRANEFLAFSDVLF